MNKAKAASILIFMLFPIFCRAQDRGVHDNLTDHFGSAGNIPGGENITADMYTGTLQVGIPIFDYKGNNGLSHSIKLNFNGRGHRVNDIASDVGLNWFVNVGGSVFREIKGLPDEDVYGFANTPAEPTSVVLGDSNLAYRYVSDSMDGQYDIYHFNIGDRTGDFVIGKNGQIVTIPESNLKVEKIQSGYTPTNVNLDNCEGCIIKITREDGVKYVFSSFDCMEINHRNRTTYAPTQWYLTKIMAPFEIDSIVFNYSVGYTSYESTNVLTQYNNQGHGGEDTYDGGFSGYHPQGGATLCVTGGPVKEKYKTMVLNSISYPNGTVVSFNRDNFYRIDLPTNYAINNIAVQNGNSGYSYLFRYRYMFRPDPTDPTFQPGDACSYMNYQDYSGQQGMEPNQVHANNFSLQLDKVSKYTIAEGEIPYYNFVYNDICLPMRCTSRATDLWGYYNGKKDEGLIPIVPAVNSNAVIYGGAYRNPDIQYAVAKSLSQVQLPTGGKVSFVYEPHHTHSFATLNIFTYPRFEPIGGLRIKKIIFDDVTGQSNQIVREYSYMESDEVTSSGVMVNSPNHRFNFYEEVLNVHDMERYKLPLYCGGVAPPHFFLDYLSPLWIVRNSEPFNSLVLTKGGYVGYDRVVEYEGTSSNYIRKHIYTFTTAETYTIPSGLFKNEVPFPYIPSYDFAWGLPLREDHYNQYNQLSSTEYTYHFYPSDQNNNNFRSIKMALQANPFADEHYYDPATPIPFSFSFANYYPISGKIFVTSKTDRTYFAGQSDIGRTTDYDYDLTHNVLRNVSTKDALDNDIFTRFYYPFDFSIAGAISTLTAKGMIYAPIRIEKRKIVGGNVAAQFLTDVAVTPVSLYNNIVRRSADYDFTPSSTVTTATWGSFNNTVLIPNASTYFTQLTTYDAYDEKGNLIQKTDHGQLVSTIWDYNKQLPTASVINAGISDVAYTSFEDASVNGGWSKIGSHGISAQAFTGRKSLQLLATTKLVKSGLNTAKTYAITFWTNGGTIFIQNAQNINIAYPVASETHNGWTLWKAQVSNQAEVRIVSINNTLIDELRLYPLEAAMTTTTYDPLFGITSECDAANRVIHTVYDSYGRVKYRKDMDGNYIKAFDYQEQVPQN